MKSTGITIAAFTESKAFYTSYRFRKLSLDGVIDYLYSPPDHEVPDGTETRRKYDAESYELKSTVHRFTPEGEVKPHPGILRSIVEELGFENHDAAYVGDNLLKDIFMAQQAQVLDIYASYGAAQHRTEQYELLKKVTHWTPEMVRQEKAALIPGAITPTRTLNSSFSEIAPMLLHE